jgi:hypothetical protein
MIERLCHRLKEPIENRPRRSEIGIHHREIEYLLTFNQHLVLKSFKGAEVVASEYGLDASTSTTRSGGRGELEFNDLRRRKNVRRHVGLYT